jgi:HNH endonuclease
VNQIHPKSTEWVEQMSIINKVRTNQTNQGIHFNDQSVTQERTATHIPKQFRRPIGFHKKPCTRCRSLNTGKMGKYVHVNQPCDSCEKALDIPQNAKSLGMYSKGCIECGMVNDIKYFQRWYCVDCGYFFTDSSEWRARDQQRKNFLGTICGSWEGTRRLVLERDNYTCQACGKTNGRLDVHHIIPRRYGGQNSMNNLITVHNVACHNKIEKHSERIALSITLKTPVKCL